MAKQPSQKGSIIIVNINCKSISLFFQTSTIVLPVLYIWPQFDHNAFHESRLIRENTRVCGSASVDWSSISRSLRGRYEQRHTHSIDCNTNGCFGCFAMAFELVVIDILNLDVLVRIVTVYRSPVADTDPIAIKWCESTHWLLLLLYLFVLQVHKSNTSNMWTDVTKIANN